MLLHGAVTSPLTRAVLLRGLWHQVAYVVVWIPASVSRAESLVNPTMKGVDVVTMGSFTAFFLQASGLINFCIFMCVRACVGCALLCVLRGRRVLAVHKAGPTPKPCA